MNTTTKIKQGFRIIAFFSFSLFVSCTNRSQTDLITNSKTKFETTKEVNFIGQWMGEGKREFIVRDFVREYEFKNQEVKINLKFPEEIGYNRYNSESTQNFTMGVFLKEDPEWDIILINDDYEGYAEAFNDPDWAKKYLVDFSTDPNFHKNVIPAINLDDVKKRWHGIIPGPFLEGQFWALWVNKQVAAKVGIEVKQYGMTYDDFLSYIKAAHQYNQNNADKITIWHEAGDWRTVFPVAIQIYLSIVNDKEEILANSIGERKLVAWYKTLQCMEELSKFNPIDPNWSNIVWNDTKNDLIEQKCLFFSNGSWMYNIWVETDPENILDCMPCEYPAFNEAPIYPTGYPIMWGVHKKSKNKEEAIKVLRAMNTSAMAEKWVRDTKCPTGIKGSFTGVTFGSDQFESFSRHIQEAYGSNAYKMRENSTFIFGLDNALQPNYFMEVLMGEVSADKAMQEIRKNLGV